MKYIRLLLIAIITSIGLLSINNCKKEIIRESLNDTIIILEHDTIIFGDKKIIFNLYQNPFHDFYNSGEIIIPTHLSDFTISDYLNIDSVSFVINGLQIINNSNPDAIDTMSLELIDMNNNNYITKSKISSIGIGVSDYVASPNLYKSFPTYSVNLGIRVSFSSGDNDSWILRNAFLVLIRK